MSLINDALKKAQSGGTSGPSTGGTPEQPQHGERQPSVKLVFAQALLMAGVMVIILAIAVFIVISALHKKGGETAAAPEKAMIEETPAPEQTSDTGRVPASNEAKADVSSPAASDAGAPLAQQPEETSSGAVAAVAETATPSAVQKPQPQAETAAPSAGSPPAVSAPSMLDPGILEYVRGITILGGANGRMLLLLPDHEETRAYEAGDMLDCGFALTLAVVKTHTLVFEDDIGRKYYKSF